MRSRFEEWVDDYTGAWEARELGGYSPTEIRKWGAKPPKTPFRWNSSNVCSWYNCVAERLEWFCFRIFVMFYYVRRNVVDTRAGA